MTIAIGDRLPEATFKEKTADGHRFRIRKDMATAISEPAAL